MKDIIKKFNDTEHPIVFFMSDLHGTPPLNVLNALHKEGYDKDNESHFVIVCGDITDGANKDNYLVSVLKDINNIIAVRGNHDTWTINHANNVWLDEDNKKWLRSLPAQIDTKHCLIAHGGYLAHIDLEMHYYDGTSINDYTSTWFSPVLLGEQPDEWELGLSTVNKLNQIFDSSIDKYENTLTKPLFIGHFWPQAVKKFFKGKGKLIEDEKGFYSYGNIHWVDSNVLQIRDRHISYKMRRPMFTVKIKKVEF